MSSAGHVLDAINRMRQNRSLRSSNRQKFKGDNRATIHAGTRGGNKAPFKEFPECQVNVAVKRIREGAKSKRWKDVAFYIFFGGTIATMIFYMMLPTNNSLGNPQAETPLYDYKWETIEWSGKSSEPLKIPDSEFLYIPVVYRLGVELREHGGTYSIYPPDMVGRSTSNVIFFDKDTLEIGKLLPRSGLVLSMYLGPHPDDTEPSNLVYMIAEEDSNRNGVITGRDQHALYVSDLNGGNLTKITDRDIRSYQWVDQSYEILMKFHQTEEIIDSLYGFYNTKTKELKLTNQLDEES